MLKRRLQSEVVGKLSQFPAVALLGPRQVGKTTLAQIIAEDRPSLYLDLEAHADRQWTIEVTRSLTPKPGKGFHHAIDDLQPVRSFVVYAGDERYPLANDIEAIGLRELAGLFSAMG